MESSLHRELKRIYAGESARTEVRLGRYIIDALVGDELVEIQHGNLSAIRDKIRTLCETHVVRIVKPLIARKYLVKPSPKNPLKSSRRVSPKKQTFLDIFEQLVRFTRAFPHPNLTLELSLVEIEDHRVPGHGRRRRYRATDHVTLDQRLLAVNESCLIRTLEDLRSLLGPRVARLPLEFTTADLSETLGIQRWQAQQIAYVFRECGGLLELGKRGGGRLYAWKPVEVAAPTVVAKTAPRKRKPRNAAVAPKPAKRKAG
ncbi:MAG: hypothetical protein QM811_30220 [Pirellulales bacterium]